MSITPPVTSPENSLHWTKDGVICRGRPGHLPMILLPLSRGYAVYWTFSIIDSVVTLFKKISCENIDLCLGWNVYSDMSIFLSFRFVTIVVCNSLKILIIVSICDNGIKNINQVSSDMRTSALISSFLYSKSYPAHVGMIVAPARLEVSRLGSAF